MDKKIIKGLIDEKLEVIQEQFSIIKAYEGKIPNIELDLYMTSIRDLYELVINLQMENMGGAMSKPAPQPEVPEVVPPPPVIEEKIEMQIPDPVEEAGEEPVETTVAEPVEHKVEEVQPPIKPPVSSHLSPNILSMEPATEQEPADEPLKDEVATAEPEAGHDRNQPHEKYQKITSDLFSEGGSNTLADSLRDGQEKRIADKLQENKVIDLRTTIGINDKFLFINELFEGNMRIYDEAVQKLNDSTTLAQIDLLLLDLKIAYNWDSESPTVKKFVELVRRKF